MRKNKDLISLFFEMVSINSESGEESEFISYLQELFTREFAAHCVKDNYGNLIIKIPSKNTRAKEPILFSVHADTVKPGKNIEPIIKEGVIYSKGKTILGADDKAGIAIIFEAIKTAERYPYLEIVVSREEETGLKGSENLDIFLLESKKGFVVDIDGLEYIVTGGPCKTKIIVDIIGKTAHCGIEPEKGISSIKVAAQAISMLKDGWVDEDTIVNIGIINGGSVLNAVPENTNVQIECRSKTDEKCFLQSELIKETFITAAKKVGAVANVKIDLIRRSYCIPDNSELIKIAEKAIKKAGLTPEPQIRLTGTDAVNFYRKGIETVVIGMGAKALHTTNENIAIRDMAKGVNIIHSILEEFC